MEHGFMDGTFFERPSALFNFWESRMAKGILHSRILLAKDR